MQEKEYHTRIALQSYSPKELRDIYGVSVKTFRVWIQPHQQVIGKLVGKRYTVKQVKIIFKLFGTPGQITTGEN